MRVRFADAKLERVETDIEYGAGFGLDIVRAFRKVMAVIRNAADERDLYAIRSLHFEKLKGSRNQQRSMRLNRQFRLIVQLEDIRGKTVVIIGIEDYH